MERLDDDRLTFSKLNNVKLNKSSRSTRPQKVNQDHKFNFDTNRKSSIVIKEDKRPKKSCKDRLIIKQDDKYIIIFNYVIAVVSAYSCVTSVYFAAFEEPSRTQEILDLCIESFFWIDIFLHFFEEYTDSKTHETVSDLRWIAYHYAFKSTFFLDFLAVFPFYSIFGGEAILTRLFRLIRLPRLINLLNNFKFIRLVTIASTITYFFGCIWFLLSKLSDDIDDQGAFFEQERIRTKDQIDQCIISSYYMLTTLSTIGYGDFFPLTNIERVICVVVMLFGVAFFSYIMGRIIEILENLNSEKSGTENDETDLKNWFTMLARFKKNRILSKKLKKNIEDYFEYFWKNDRLASIKADNEYMKALPRSIKRRIMINYLFGDVLFLFRHFFRTVDNLDSKFLYTICFGFQPRRFNEGEIIYEEESECPEIYFIMNGLVNVGCRLPWVAKPFMMQKVLKERQIIADFYVCFNKKAEFLYQALRTTECYCLSKKHINEVFSKFPAAANRVKEHCIDRYKAVIKQPMMEMRAQKLEELNLRSAYKVVKYEDKEEPKTMSEEKIIEKKNNFKVQKELKKKIDVIQEKMNKFLNRFKKSENINNTGFQNFLAQK